MTLINFWINNWQFIKIILNFNYPNVYTFSHSCIWMKRKNDLSSAVIDNNNNVIKRKRISFYYNIINKL